MLPESVPCKSRQSFIFGVRTPLWLLCLYLLTTISIAIWGPREYDNFNKESVIRYMAWVILALIIGFNIAVKTFVCPAFAWSSLKQSPKLETVVLKILKFCIVICLIYSVIHLIDIFLKGNFNLSLNLGQKYIDYHTAKNELHGNGVGTGAIRATPLEIIYLLLGFPRIICMTWGVLYFNLLCRRYKIFLVIVLFLLIFISVFLFGHQKVMADFLIYFGTMFMIKMQNQSTRFQRKVLRALIISGCLFFVLCCTIQSQRYISLGIDGLEINEKLPEYTWYNPEHIIFRVLGTQIGLGVSSMLTAYLSAGYYSLSLCLQLPFVFTWGFSVFSPFAKIFYSLTGVNMMDAHYVSRMVEEFDVTGFAAWHTVFPFLAGDFTFPGVVVVLGVIAWIWGTCWLDILYFRNPFSVVLFSVLNIGMIFIPSNSQLLWGVDSNIAFWIIIFIWIRWRKKYNRQLAGVWREQN